MPTIFNLTLKPNEKRYFLVRNGTVTEQTRLENTEYMMLRESFTGGVSLGVAGANAFGKPGLGLQFDGRQVAPGTSYEYEAFGGNPLIMVTGTVTGAAPDGGDVGEGGGEVGSAFDDGGDPPVAPPIPPGADAGTALPTGNGNTGFTSSGPAGAETGINGGNA